MNLWDLPRVSGWWFVAPVATPIPDMAAPDDPTRWAMADWPAGWVMAEHTMDARVLSGCPRCGYNPDARFVLSFGNAGWPDVSAFVEVGAWFMIAARASGGDVHLICHNASPCPISPGVFHLHRPVSSAYPAPSWTVYHVGAPNVRYTITPTEPARVGALHMPGVNRVRG